MLVLTVKANGRVYIGTDIVITLTEVVGSDRVRLGFDAPKDVEIKREKLLPKDDPRRKPR